jgi:hypothetical protein
VTVSETPRSRPNPVPRPDLGERLRIADAVDQLCKQLAQLCASAVDALEIAATLEAELGITGRLARTRYRFPDVFSLAEEMHRRTTRRPVEPEPEPEPWPAAPATHLLHGLLYALPAVCYAVAGPLLQGTGALLVVVVAMLVSWALSQALSYLGYLRLGRPDPGGAARLLRRGLAGSVVALLMVLGAAALLVPVAIPVLLFAAAQGAYLLGATVLLVMRAQGWLLAALAPGVLASAGYLLAHRPAPVTGLAWLPLVVCALLALVFAAIKTARPGPTIGRVLVGAELGAALPHALFGLITAGLLAFPVVVIGFGGGTGLPAAALLTLPLSLSMGAGEWSLYWYRRRMRGLLQAARTVGQFAPRARLALLGAVARYFGAVMLLISATLAVALAGRMPPEWTLLHAGGSYLALGCALFVALLLQAVATGLFPLLACAAALGVEVALVIGLPLGWGLDVMSAQLLACSVLFAGLLMRCDTVLGQVVTHT